MPVVTTSKTLVDATREQLPAPELPLYLTVAEAAAVARRTPNALYLLHHSKEKKGPTFRKVDGRLLVRRDDLLAWLDGETA